MSSVTVKFKDGTSRKFQEQGRAGGSWSVSVTYAEGMVIVEDEWGTRTAFPMADIAEVVEIPRARSSW